MSGAFVPNGRYDFKIYLFPIVAPIPFSAVLFFVAPVANEYCKWCYLSSLFTMVPCNTITTAIESKLADNLSRQLWHTEKSELANYRELYRKRKVPPPLLFALYLFRLLSTCGT